MFDYILKALISESMNLVDHWVEMLQLEGELPLVHNRHHHSQNNYKDIERLKQVQTRGKIVQEHPKNNWKRSSYFFTLLHFLFLMNSYKR